MRIGFDLDGVLANFNDPMKDLLGNVYKRDLPWDPQAGGPTVWNWPQLEFRFTNAEVNRVWEDYINPGGFWSELPALNSDEMDHVVELARNHEVYFITNRSGASAKRESERWLKKQGVYCPTVLITAEKVLAARTLSLEVYIDDKAENNVGMPETTRVYLKRAAYNDWSQDRNIYPEKAFGIPVNSVTCMLSMEGL